MCGSRRSSHDAVVASVLRIMSVSLATVNLRGQSWHRSRYSHDAGRADTPVLCSVAMLSGSGRARPKIISAALSAHCASALAMPSGLSHAGWQCVARTARSSAVRWRHCYRSTQCLLRIFESGLRGTLRCATQRSPPRSTAPAGSGAHCCTAPGACWARTDLTDPAVGSLHLKRRRRRGLARARWSLLPGGGVRPRVRRAGTLVRSSTCNVILHYKSSR